jgi:dihydrofolate reductase
MAFAREIVAVVGVASNGVIGRDGAIPWRSSLDMKHFRSVTTGHPIVMGRRTFESIGRLLPDRLNVIMTRDTRYEVQGALVLHSKEAVLERLAGEPRIMVIGGDQIYREFYPDLTSIELTHIGLETEGDAFFELDSSRDWLIESVRGDFDERLGAPLEFRTYVPDRTKNPYLSTDVKGLLRLFGAGEPIPGSGAAAALQALLGAYLILTVLRISRERNPSRDNRRVFAQYSYEVSSAIVPRLRSLFLEDIEVFGQVVPLRQRRSAAKGTEKARITRELNGRMAEATAIPNQVFGIATELFKIAEYLYENGYAAVRGDSGAAMSSALSAMLSCSFVIGLNAKTLSRSAGESWIDRAAERHRETMAAIARMPRYLSVDRPADPAQMTLNL